MDNLTRHRTVLQFKSYLLGKGMDRTLVDAWIPRNIFSADVPLTTYVSMIDMLDMASEEEKAFIRAKVGEFILTSFPHELWAMDTGYKKT